MKKLVTQITFAAILAFAVSSITKASGLLTISNYTESSLTIENWMTDESIWSTVSSINANLLLETESPLELENWMMNNNFGMIFQLETEAEKELDVENWMIDSKYWQLNDMETEEKLELEDWMINSTIWR